jgi:hypothetical protein
MELRTIDFDKEKYFECQGRKFYVKDVPSFTRYRELQKINIEFGFSATFLELYKSLRETYELLNKSKPADAAVFIHNVLYGIVNIDDKYDPAWRLCAIFIDEEGEDPTVYDEAKMREKIDCWGKELNPLPFFQLAANLVPNWINVYQNFSQNGLGKEGTEKIESPQ